MLHNFTIMVDLDKLEKIIGEFLEDEAELMWRILHFRRRPKHHPITLAIFFHHKHHYQMTTSLTLVDKNVHVAVFSVVDVSKTPAVLIPGKISNLQESTSDATIDTVSTDPNDANEADVQAVANTGSAVLGFTADFISDDGTINVQGLSVTLPVTNNIPVEPPPPPPVQPALVVDIS